MRLMQHLLPQLEQFCTAGNVNDENIVVDFLKTTTMVGLLPVSVCLSTTTMCVSLSTTTMVGLLPVPPPSPRHLPLLAAWARFGAKPGNICLALDVVTTSSHSHTHILLHHSLYMTVNTWHLRHFVSCMPFTETYVCVFTGICMCDMPHIYMHV